MKKDFFTPSRLVSTGDSAEEKIALLSEQVDRLRDDLNEILEKLNSRLDDLGV